MLKIVPQNEWGWNEILQNKTNHLLEVLVWTKTKDAQKKNPQNYPKPYIPKFLQTEEKRPTEQVAMSVEDLQAYLTKPRK